jgi:hypothetical protein
MKHKTNNEPPETRQTNSGEGPEANVTTTYTTLAVSSLVIAALYIVLSNRFHASGNYVRIAVLATCLLAVFFLKPRRGNETRGKYYMYLLANFILLFSSVAGLSSIASSFQRSARSYFAAKNNAQAVPPVVQYLIPGKPLWGVSSRKFEDEVNKKQAIISEKNHHLVQTFSTIEALSLMKKRAHTDEVSWLFYGKKRRGDSVWEVRNFSADNPGAPIANSYIPAKGDKLKTKKEMIKRTAIIIDSSMSQLNSDAGLLEANTIVEVIEVVHVVNDGYWILAAEESGM